MTSWTVLCLWDLSQTPSWLNLPWGDYSKAMFTACTDQYLPMQPKICRACACSFACWHIHPDHHRESQWISRHVTCAEVGSSQRQGPYRWRMESLAHLPCWCGAVGHAEPADGAIQLLKWLHLPIITACRLCFCRSSTGTAELRPLRGVIQTIHRTHHSLGNRSGKSPFAVTMQFPLPAA